MDYRDLNNITIKERLSIHITDVLLDELWGKKYFFKLVLRASYPRIRVKSFDKHKIIFKTY